MQSIDPTTITTIYTPGGSFVIEPGSLELGGVPWITGQGGTFRFNEAKTKRRIMVPVGAVCAVEVNGALHNEPERFADESPVAAATRAMATA